MTRPTADDLRRWYATQEGRRVARTIARIVAPVVRVGPTTRLLALGYPTPILTGLDPRRLERLAIVMPRGQGGHRWPSRRPNRALVAGTGALPFGAALFDQVLAIHALEFAEPPQKMLRELWRVLTPAGEAIFIVASRSGLWTHLETTPFGEGRPYGQSQLLRLLREHMFEPVAWRTALALPPGGVTGALNRPLMALAPRLGSVRFVLARKSTTLRPALVGKAATVTAPRVAGAAGALGLGVPVGPEPARCEQEQPRRDPV